MSAPHRVPGTAGVVDLGLVLLLLAALGWLATAAVQRLRRLRRWPRPPRSWLRDYRAEAEQRRRDRDGGAS